MDALEKVAQLKAMAEADPLDPLTFYMLGAEQLHAGLAADAVNSLRSALALNPDHTAAVRLLGDVYRRLGRLEEARAAYEHAIVVAERTGDLQVAKEARAFLRKLA
jgi:Flp pilus assembly protein TadD